MASPWRDALSLEARVEKHDSPFGGRVVAIDKARAISDQQSQIQTALSERATAS